MQKTFCCNGICYKSERGGSRRDQAHGRMRKREEQREERTRHTGNAAKKTHARDDRPGSAGMPRSARMPSRSRRRMAEAINRSPAVANKHNRSDHASNCPSGRSGGERRCHWTRLASFAEKSPAGEAHAVFLIRTRRRLLSITFAVCDEPHAESDKARCPASAWVISPHAARSAPAGR